MNSNASVRPRRLAAGIAILATAGLALAACADDRDSTGSNANPNVRPDPTTVAPVAPQPKPTVDLRTNAAIGQDVLVDSNGMTLYLFIPDGTGPVSTVPAEFKPNWPPVVANGAPLAGTGLDGAKLGVQPQPDGAHQVTYNGHLLYTFINDKAPGDANGQGLGPNSWFVLNAAGDPILAAKPTVSLAPNATVGQPVLVDANGMTLYLFIPDGDGTKTTVPVEFKPNWPQLIAD